MPSVFEIIKAYHYNTNFLQKFRNGILNNYKLPNVHENYFQTLIRSFSQTLRQIFESFS